MACHRSKPTRRAKKTAVRSASMRFAYSEPLLTRQGSGKTERLQLRMTLRVKSLIRMAAAAKNKDVTEFMVDAAVKASEEALADRRRFVVDETTWRRFTAALDKPASLRLREEKPNLARVLSEPSILES